MKLKDGLHKVTVVLFMSVAVAIEVVVFLAELAVVAFVLYMLWKLLFG